MGKAGETQADDKEKRRRQPMMAVNGSISDRQFRRLLVVDCFAKGAVLLPDLAAGVPVRIFLLGLLLGCFLVMGYVCLLCGIHRRALKREGECRKGEKALAVCFLVYSFWNLVYLASAFGEIGTVFLLPESRKETLMAMMILAGAIQAAGGVEARARTGTVLYHILVWPMAVLLIAGAFGIRPEHLASGNVLEELNRSSTKEMFGMALRIFLAFGGIGTFVFVMPMVSGESGKAFRKGMALTCGLLFGMLVVLIGVFGEGGLKNMQWPVIQLMSSAELPGIFVNRWDAIFTGLLLTELFAAAGTSLFYLNLCGSRLWNHGEKGQIFLWAAGVFAVALWCQNWEQAEQFFLQMGLLAAGAGILLNLFRYWKLGGERRVKS